MEKTLSLIVPVYNEEEVLETSFSRMDAVMKKIRLSLRNHLCKRWQP